MAELTPRERLQPCLLDRLTDDEPDQQKESRDARVIPLQRYRRAVLRDMAWLLNTDCHTETEELAEFEQAALSVLNYGVRDVCGLSISGFNIEELERKMQLALRTFEPRILPGSLSVKALVDPHQMNQSALSFEIKGELWAQRATEALYIKTEVDLETGRWELAGGGST